jgi:hypothetical protein
MATIEQLRVLVQDPEGSTALLSDDDLDEILAIEPNVYRAAATAARLLAAQYAAKVKVTAGPVSVENQQAYEHYANLAKAYDQRAREGGGGLGVTGSGVGGPALSGVSASEVETQREDTDRIEPAFRRGLTDNVSDTFDETVE